MEKRMEREKKERENREKKAETAVLILGWLQGEFINYLKLDAKFYICIYMYTCTQVKYILGMSISPSIENHCSTD